MVTCAPACHLLGVRTCCGTSPYSILWGPGIEQSGGRVWLHSALLYPEKGVRSAQVVLESAYLTPSGRSGCHDNSSSRHGSVLNCDSTLLCILATLPSPTTFSKLHDDVLEKEARSEQLTQELHRTRNRSKPEINAVAAKKDDEILQVRGRIQGRG